MSIVLETGKLRHSKGRDMVKVSQGVSVRAGAKGREHMWTEHGALSLFHAGPPCDGISRGWEGGTGGCGRRGSSPLAARRRPGPGGWWMELQAVSELSIGHYAGNKGVSGLSRMDAGKLRHGKDIERNLGQMEGWGWKLLGVR